jgi:hypothetical protein
MACSTCGNRRRNCTCAEQGAVLTRDSLEDLLLNSSCCKLTKDAKCLFTDLLAAAGNSYKNVSLNNILSSLFGGVEAVKPGILSIFDELGDLLLTALTNPTDAAGEVTTFIDALTTLLGSAKIGQIIDNLGLEPCNDCC